MKKHPIQFASETYETVSVPEGQTLSEELTVQNSPVLFGCRTGICGTCVVVVLDGQDELAPPDEEEKEILELYLEDTQHARLACQINVRGPLKIKSHCENRWSG
jgi:ferredoxin